MFSKISNRVKHFLFHVENDWEIGYFVAPFRDVLENQDLPVVKWLQMPKDVFWADPFGVFHNDQYFIFFEEFLKTKNYGRICCIILSDSFEILSKQTSIDEGVHFSFPNVLKHRDEFYMLPETHQKSKLSLYKSHKFPGGWEEECTLLDLPCVDSILYFNDGFWHLFYGKFGSENNLYLRRNKSLKEGWGDRHEMLVNSNAFNSRNAGSIVEVDGTIYRPSQNCSTVYGESVVLNQILNLSANSYEEEIVKEISTKSKGATCCHTLNCCGNLIWIDQRRERRFIKPWREIVNSVITKFTA